ncbi:8493_t:CDS:2 [Scutellospora calospora]|uniref:8493_t:CDS:1 n=1 Tax=Scutellospora calospora TaxID=85575 RepID=A0ACA9KDK5_9GLOM|nr:8493_t:CDS:2 [Scutellospora calospora]
MIWKEESDYPESPDIVLKDEHQTFKFHIIKEGVYLPKNKLKYTRRPAKYPIPHNYVVQTTYSKKKYIVECLIVYIDDKPLYQIYFGEYLDKLVESDQSTSHAAQLYYETLFKDIQNNEQAESKSRLSGPLLFGLCCKSVEEVRKTVTSNELVRMKPFNNYSTSAQCKHILGLGKRMLEFVEEEKENFFHPNDNIVLKQAKFEISDHTYNINYGKIDEQQIELQTQAIVKSIDLNEKIPISLVDIDQLTSFEPITEESDITDPIIVSNVIASIGKGRQRRITDILNYIVPFYIQREVLNPGSTLHLRISGDGRNVGKKVKHVMVTVALLNSLVKLHKPESHYTLVLFPSMENYYSLQNTLAPLISDLRFLNEHGFYEVGGRYWNVELYFSSDWKFLAICLGMNAANSNLYAMLRISDRLWELFLSDLQRGGQLNENLQNLILTEMKRLRINHFHFWIENTTQSSSYTSLMGPDKLNILENFGFTNFISKKFSQERAIKLRQLWTGFFELYKMMTLPNITGSEFKVKAES